MDVFSLRDGLVKDYCNYIRSFITIQDTRIDDYVKGELDRGLLWPEPLLQLNPSFQPGPLIDSLLEKKVLHNKCGEIFRIKDGQESRPLRIYQHQADAIEAAKSGDSYVLTTGTGSGKSLTYIIPIVDHVLRAGSGDSRIKAIIIYPMNALANSQFNELEKFLCMGFPEGKPPVTFARYTGQEKWEDRERIKNNPPDILLTNYVMMELIMTRPFESKIIDAAKGLQFLVLDELHTYRGRQGADVGLLVRRIRERVENPKMQCIGTSATLAGGGTFTDQQHAIAGVASRLFGTEVKAEGIIGETLNRVTPEMDVTKINYINELITRLTDSRYIIPETYDDFIKDPLAAWIESTFGLSIEEETMRLRRARPISIRGREGAAACLAVLTELDEEGCASAIEKMLLAGYKVKNPQSGFPVFAFRLHQFISRGDTVYSTLEDAKERIVTTRGQQSVPGDPSKLLFPLVFCRDCGQDYYAIRMNSTSEDGIVRVDSRNPNELKSDGEGRNGYLFRNTQALWKEELNDELLDRLPDHWLELSGNERRVKKDCRSKLPHILKLNTMGEEKDSGIEFAFVGSPFLFCPNCGVAYSARIRSDYGRLATLSSEGRSTATTVLTLSTLLRLRDELSLSDDARKILSFTDNRQDASLQAGHFNDFVQIGLLRAAVYKAINDAGPEGVPHHNLTMQVFDALKLPLAAYACDPGVKFSHKEQTERALREILGYLLYQDLRRGWRVISPNLEQCGLLEIHYSSLKELCEDQDTWKGCHQALADASWQDRMEISKVLLDYLRRELAIKVTYLNPGDQEALIQLSSQKLRAPWALDEMEKLQTSAVAYPRSVQKKENRRNVFVSPRGGFGRFLRNHKALVNLKLKDEVLREIIAQLFKALAVGILEVVDKPKNDDEPPGYQIPASAFAWVAGDGTKPFHDPITMPRASREGGRTNSFFVRFYTEIASHLAMIEAREHTAQVPYEARVDRETRFKTAELPLLFCSPTMELGVDIARLNAVNMRNVPPTPANYAQRSGRAGRSGQPALVFTYCTTGSPHDQYFFRHPELMVSGEVAPPRLDLANEDLVKAHVYAVWISDADLGLGDSLKDVLDVSGTEPSLTVLPSIVTKLESPEARKKAMKRLNAIVGTFVEELSGSDWFTDDWLVHTLNQVEARFEDSCERWRGLFKAARAQKKAQDAIIDDPSRSSKDKDAAKRSRAEAESQQELLLDGSRSEKSDFYSYRYFAGEGFLPGYNFPRLPLSAFIPGKRHLKAGNDEYLSRPRFLAIAEFGPRSIIYHEGSKYDINKVIMPAGVDALTTSAKICPSCGYLHTAGAGDPLADICEQCQAPLSTPMNQLFRMQNVSTRRRDRINSDEEERQRMGYEIRTAVRFGAHGKHSAVRSASIMSKDAHELLKLTYCHSATLWRINLGWKRRTEDSGYGFLLDKEKGLWASNKLDTDDMDDPLGSVKIKVIPYVEDWRNALIIEPSEQYSKEFMASLQPAIENAIQVIYQIEDSELTTESLPNPEVRRSILIYESAEGGAGVLRRLVDDPDAFIEVAKKAMEICHFDPHNGADLGMSSDMSKGCGSACYDCLMSYYNQPDHRYLNRNEIKEFLMELSTASVKTSPRPVPREEHYARLKYLCDSELERQWLDLLEENNLHLPDEAQVLIAECETKPDFFYSAHRTAIYIDGPVHDEHDIVEKDARIEECLMDKGYSVIRFRHKEREKWPELLAKYTSIFGKMKEKV